MGGEQLQLKGEGHYVWVSARQAAIVGEMAEPAIGRQVAGLHTDEAAQTAGGQGNAADLAFAGGAQVEAGA